MGDLTSQRFLPQRVGSIGQCLVPTRSRPHTRPGRSAVRRGSVTTVRGSGLTGRARAHQVPCPTLPVKTDAYGGRRKRERARDTKPGSTSEKTLRHAPQGKIAPGRPSLHNGVGDPGAARAARGPDRDMYPLPLSGPWGRGRAVRPDTAVQWAGTRGQLKIDQISVPQLGGCVVRTRRYVRRRI